MNRFILILTLLSCFTYVNGQEKQVDRSKIKEDLEEILTDLSRNYVYLQQKKVDLDCIRTYYGNQIQNIKTEEETVLFFEYLLDEFYDSHLILNTNRKSSYRLFSPIYTTFQNGKAFITNSWQIQAENFGGNLIGAEIIKINGIDFKDAIAEFPTHCNDKTLPKVREWIANKLLAGRYNQPRMLTLRLNDQRLIEFDFDKIRYKNDSGLLSSKRKDNIGIICINNSLGNNDLIEAFDKVLDSLADTKALIIDLRNTVDGGNSYVARGIMSRFITEPRPYQKHKTTEKYGNHPAVERTWVEYVSPRARQYNKPVFILVGRWTGSMGEGLAIGFEGMGRAEIVGTEMERLAGEMSGFSLKHQNFGYRLSTASLFHINGIPREEYVPKNYVKQRTSEKDETLLYAFELISKITVQR
jgi:carboxyl-terminal processing protease